jgi:MoaA/NifB/PqqE/SkfB family radical SAM enzyme
MDGMPMMLRDSRLRLIDSDPRFDRRFNGRLMQVFLYITDECNIRCMQCYYKPALKKGHTEMPTGVALQLLRKFRELGAVKLSLLGGEPTLYGHAPGNEPVPYLIEAAKKMGFEYVRMVTNGLFKRDLLHDERLHAIDEITFSIDGDTPEIHDALRGRGTFERTLRNLRETIRQGNRVHVTMCVHRGNAGRALDGSLVLSRAIKWAAEMGIKSFNIHPLFQMGVARDAWTGETNIDPQQWMQIYDEIRTGLRRGEFKIPVRMPLRFVSASKFEANPRYHGYCSIKAADRLDVHLNGQMHTCALHSATPTSIARFEQRGKRIQIDWAEANNELSQHSFDDGREQPCAIMKGFPTDLKPLCISLKPDQDEYIWNRMGLE